MQATYQMGIEENRPNIMPAARTFEEEMLLNTESFEKQLIGNSTELNTSTKYDLLNIEKNAGKIIDLENMNTNINPGGGNPQLNHCMNNHE